MKLGCRKSHTNLTLACFTAASVGAGLPCRCCWWKTLQEWVFFDRAIYLEQKLWNQNLYATLFPQLILAKVSCAVDAHVHSSVTTEKVTPPVTPHSNYTSWEFPGFNAAEGSIFPLMVWHSLKINNAITPQNGFSYGDVWRTGMDCICKTCFRAQICFCALQMCSWCQQLCIDDITGLWKTRSVWHRWINALANITVLIQRGGSEHAAVLPCLNSSLPGEQRQAFSAMLRNLAMGKSVIVQMRPITCLQRLILSAQTVGNGRWHDAFCLKLSATDCYG